MDTAYPAASLGLVDHNPRIRHSESLPLGAPGQQQRSLTARQPEGHCAHVGLDLDGERNHKKQKDGGSEECRDRESEKDSGNSAF